MRALNNASPSGRKRGQRAYGPRLAVLPPCGKPTSSCSRRPARPCNSRRLGQSPLQPSCSRRAGSACRCTLPEALRGKASKASKTIKWSPCGCLYPASHWRHRRWGSASLRLLSLRATRFRPSTTARPHMSLRVPLPEQKPHALELIQPTWRHRTPGMAAGLTDHVWTFRELLTVKFEPIRHQSGSG